jgi:catechol 2,3-dioxygenase-like lactoylglutathione lyase family enzyme
MIEGISAVTLGTHEMPRAVRFYRALGFEVCMAAKTRHSPAFGQERAISTSSPSVLSGTGPGGGG